MLLSVLERMLLGQILPKEGTITNLKLLREVREALSFTEEENKRLNFRQDGDNVRWDDFTVTSKATGMPVEGPPETVQAMLEAAPDAYSLVPTCEDKEIGFGDVANKLIVDSMNDLSDQGKLTEVHVDLYDKFNPND